MDETTTAIVVALLCAMIAVAWLELRYLRKSSKARRIRAVKRGEELPDEANNALLTTRAIIGTMAERNGIHSKEVESLLNEAQMAYDRHNYRVTLDLTTKAKERLIALKSAQASKGDLAKLEIPSPANTADAEPTTKERLQKDFPPNLLQARFSISMAESSIEDGRTAGRNVDQAETLLASAKSRYEAQDFNGALSAARLADKSAKGAAIQFPPPAAVTPTVTAPEPATFSSGSSPGGSTCPLCGAAIRPGDAFCRKCGAQAVLTGCPTCGASLQADDVFCRKCETRLVR
jgi:predicted nucleic acid-binding Zn ribbon protein